MRMEDRDAVQRKDKAEIQSSLSMQVLPPQSQPTVIKNTLSIEYRQTFSGHFS